MSWHAQLFRTRTGRLGAELRLGEGGSWDIPLNGVESFDVTVQKAQLARIHPSWWSMWGASVVVSWKGVDGVLKPWLAGPITEPPTETRGPGGTATLSCSGIGALLARRYVLAREFAMDPSHRPTAALPDLAKSSVVLRGMSLGTIAQEVVRLSTEAKLGGSLPIRYASPRETGATLNERTYEGWNLANNEAMKRLTELANVINGPDIAFRPEWGPEGTVQWAMYHGTAAQPAIAQEWGMDLDSTASRSPVADVSPTLDGSGLAGRVYWTGAGEGAGTLIRLAQDTSRLADEAPLLETVGSTSDSENAGLIADHAAAALAAGRAPIRQLSFKVDGSDPRAEIGRWHVGDLARVTVGEDDWLTIPGGTRFERIISAKGSFSSAQVTLEFQPDGEPYTPDTTTEGA